jgi:uncharacterized membrane protein YczE
MAGDLDGLACQAGPMRRDGLPIRLVQLYIGLWLYGTSGALQVRARLGLDPWDVLHQGLANHLGLQIGTVVIIVGAAVLLLWIPLRQWPGVGTISNVVLVGLAMNVTLDVVPHTSALDVRIAELGGGIVLCGLATGMYIGANLGPGPRDGLMTGLARVTGRSIRLTRTCLEVVVLGVGFLLGGTVGIGTVLFAASIGPLAQLFLPVFATGRREVSRPNPRRRGRARWPAGRSGPRSRDGNPRRPAADRRATRA